MTWADVVATGDCTGVAYRLVVEGWPDVWVTDARITASAFADGRSVRPGLKYTGLKIRERAVLREAWVQAEGIKFTINPTGDGSGGGVGVDEDTMSSFTRTPVPVGWLKVSMPAGGSDKLYFANGAVFAIGTTLHVATETIRVSSGSAADSDGVFTFVERAKWHTTEQNHLISYGPGKAVIVPVYTHPPTMEGRRCYLYAYGPGDSTTGDGTIIWKGVVSSPPRMNSDGLSWTIQADNISKVLEQKVAAASGLEYRIRGIYHPNTAPFNFWATAIFDAFHFTNSETLTMTQLAGFYETQDEWVTAVNAFLGFYASGTASDYIDTLYYEERGPSPVITMNIKDNDDVALVVLESASVLEGDLQYQNSVLKNQSTQETHKVGEGFEMEDGVGPIYWWDHYLGDSSQEYSCYGFASSSDDPSAPPFTYPLPASRAVAGSPNRTTKPPFFNYTLFSDYLPGGFPSNRIYLNTVEELEIGDTLAILNGDSAVLVKLTNVVEGTDSGAGSRYVDFDFMSGDSVVYMTDQTRIVPVRTFENDGGLDDFCAGLIAASPNANDGDTPFITADDMDFSALLLAYGGYATIDDFWKHRSYAFLKPVPVKTILAEELKAIGWMMRLDQNGACAFAPLPLVSGTTDASASITDTEILLPAGKSGGMWPQWEAQTDGIVNVVTGRFGYKPIEDDFDPSRDATIREITSIAEHKSNGKGTAEIAPRSTPARVPQIRIRVSVNGFPKYITKGGGERAGATPQQIAAWISSYMRVLSMDYSVVTIAVPFKFFGLLIGDIVEVTSALIPNGLGGRGITSQKAAIVGREWNLDPSAGGGMGKLTLYFPRQVSGGYTPSGRVTAQSNLGGNNWRITMSAANAFNLRWSDNGSGNVAKHFAVNDAVRVVLVNSASPTTIAGTVTATNPGAGTVDVSLGSTWTPGASTWNLIFQHDSAATTRQRNFVFIADSTQSLANGDTARQLL